VIISAGSGVLRLELIRATASTPLWPSSRQ